MFDDIFEKRRVNAAKLLSYGFCKGEKYIYSTCIMNDSFALSVIIDKNGSVDTCLTEKDTGEPYELYKTNAEGAYIGEVRREIEAVLRDVSEKCFDSSVFKQKQTLMLIDCVRRKYGDELEFLWEKFSDNAIWRRADNKKWYAVVLTIKKSKLGLKSEDTVEVIDLRIEPEKMAELIDCERYFPGWHMNKKHWYTIILDGSVSLEELCLRVGDSYRLAKKQH